MKVIEAIISKLSDPSLNYDYAALFQTVPVSYTHLDVYKRQPLWGRQWDMPVMDLPHFASGRERSVMVL